MKQKSKFRRFWNLDHRKSDGFTLIELIVVIAIMAILGGVGTAGYGGYIKATNKNADKKLVGDIMRAIETGTNTMMFVNDDSFKLGKMSYPVGFIALSADGSSVVASSSEKNEGVKEACVFTEVTVKKLATNSVRKTCGLSSKTKDVTTITNETIRYCSVHGSAPTALSSDTTYITDFSGCTNSGLFHSHNWDANTSSTTLPAGTLIADSNVKLQSGKDTSRCEYAYANKDATFTGATNVGATTEGPIVGALEAAFGNLDNLKLKYDGWKSEDGISYATFYNSASDLMDDIESLSGLLVVGSNLVGSNRLGLSKDYANSQEVMEGVSNSISQTHKNQDSWMNQWNNDANMTWNSYGFGLAGRENYSAARVAYNNGFASYLDAMDSTGTSPYSERIRNFNSQELAGVGLPGLVCSDAFTAEDSKLKEKFTADELETVYGLYQDYLKSDAYTENGKVIYDTLSTFAETSDIAKDKNNAFGGDMFDYYNSYVDEINALYDAAGSAAGDGIVIIVSVQDGETVFTVSPSAANPRAEK